MFPAAARLLHIKDLKALSFFGRRCYRHIGPLGPKEMSLFPHIPQVAPCRLGTVVQPCPIILLILLILEILLISCSMCLAWRGTGPRATVQGQFG